MHTFLAATLVAASFTTYPTLGDRAITEPKAAAGHPRVEAATDKGPIVELIVRCPKGTTIIAYSKIERLYCSPRLACGRSLREIAAVSCS